MVSYLEIYNEQIRDLLLPNDKDIGSGHLNLKEIPNEGVTVPGKRNARKGNGTVLGNYLSMYMLYLCGVAPKLLPPRLSNYSK